MTPAMMLAMLDKKWEDMETAERPIAQVSCLLYNINRSPGDKDKGTPPAPSLPIDKFYTRKRRAKGKKGKSSAAEDGPNPGGPHVLNGAECDRPRMEAMMKGISKVEVIPEARRPRR